MIGQPVSGSLADRYAGCLVGLACGDALGMPLLNLSRVDVEDRFGTVSSYLAAGDSALSSRLEEGMYTADSQLALLVARLAIAQTDITPDAFRRELGAWIKRVDRQAELGRAIEPSLLWAGRMLYRDDPDNAPNASDDNGAIPVGVVAGLVFPHDAERAVNLARSLARTISTSTAVSAGVAVLALAVGQCATASALDPWALLGELAEHAETTSSELASRIRRAQALREKAAADALQELGTGRTVLQSLPAALFCFALASQDPGRAVTLAISQGEDAPTNGGLAGALTGALNGYQRLPRVWLEGLENGVNDCFGYPSLGRDGIIQLAHELAAEVQAPETVGV